jgi:hypothetical protein
MTRGEYKYLPKELVEELNNTKVQFKVNKDCDAFKIIATNSRLAKELRFNLDFKWNKRK